MKPHSLRLLATALLLLPLSPLAAANEPAQPAHIAGLAPWQRPAQAPRLTADPPLDRKRSLHGVSEPLPPNLKFLDDQGGWYNPFIHPGMPAPYDLRGWHAHPPFSRQNKK
jgi:hypothetical protein